MNEMDSYNVSFRCFFPSDDGARFTSHYQRLSLSDLPKWFEAYRFTHPTCLSISCKVWFTELEQQDGCSSDYD